MALSTDSELKEQILYNLGEYSESGEPPHYDTDFIVGFADSQVPIYYNEVIEEWQQLPSEYIDSWQETGAGEGAGIFSLMSLDLFNYYHDKTSEILDEIRQEQVGEDLDKCRLGCVCSPEERKQNA